MINYDCKLVWEALNEICAKFEKTKNIKIKKVKKVSEKRAYQATLSNGTTHLIDQQLIKDYIESFGEKGSLKIAANLIHDTELEESARKQKQPEIDEYWEGSMKEVKEYLEKKERDKNKE
jgi:hypothetical protein